MTETETENLTPWHRYVRAPLRTFSSSETGGAAILLASTVAALIWVNINAHSYNAVWDTTFAVRFGHGTVNQDLRGWVNTGLMTFFFLVVGLEARGNSISVSCVNASASPCHCSLASPA